MKQTLNIRITLNWSEWTPGDEVDKADIPNAPGVYEVKYEGSSEKRLTIGKASNLRMRVKHGLVKGSVPHSTGERIREKEDTSKLLVRWAMTDRPAAAEEELLRRYFEKFNELPKYAKCPKYVKCS